MKLDALQTALYAQLEHASVTALLSTAYAPEPAIFSDVPQSDDSENDAAFPYIVIGGDTLTPFDTKDNVGGSAIAQVDLYYRGTSKLILKQLATAVDARLRRQALTITGATHITTELESATPTPDPDGKTFRLLLLYRILWLET